jgi:hypothetical protein
LDELYEPLNSGSTHRRLIDRAPELPQTPFMTGRKQNEAPNRKGESLMKSQKTLVLAASIFALALSAFPHDAAASTGTTPPPPLPACCKGTHIPEVTIDAVFVLSLLNLL